MPGVLKRLEFIASLIPERSIALTSGNCQVTYKELVDEVKQRISWLRGIKSEVVALYSDNTAEWVLIDLACQELELVFIPLPAFFSANQIQDCLRRSGVDTLLSDRPEVLGFTDSQFTSIPYHEHLASMNAIHAWKFNGSSSTDLPISTQKITFTSGLTLYVRAVLRKGYLQEH